jgi:hypothetical protein
VAVVTAVLVVNVGSSSLKPRVLPGDDSVAGFHGLSHVTCPGRRRRAGLTLNARRSAPERDLPDGHPAAPR